MHLVGTGTKPEHSFCFMTYFYTKTTTYKATGKAQWIKELAAKPNNLSSSPRVHMLEEEN